MDHPLISIIMPVYNGQKYLRQCIDSIVSQTYSNWELLLIDDGSTDDSAHICDDFAKSDRITVVHQQNSGQAVARNNGIAMAKGALISFVDCDDWLDTDMYGMMVDAMQQTHSQVVVCGYMMEYTNGRKTVDVTSQQTVYSSTDMLKLLLTDRIGSYPWAMLFSRQVVQEPMANLKCFEDYATLFKWIAHADKVAVLPRAFYHYRQTEGSSLHSKEYQRGCDFFKAIKERYTYIARHGLLPDWEAENRRCYIKNCIKLTKDMARAQVIGQQVRTLIEDVKEELQQLMPISREEAGSKNYRRLRLLFFSTSLYIHVLRLSAIFSLGGKHKQQHLYR